MVYMASNKNINLELIQLVWLDNMANVTEENREIQEKLRSIINSVRVFESCQSCENYLQNEINDKIYLIVSGRLGEEITKSIHDFKQIISIFVFCFDKEKNEIWAKKYPKIRNVIVKLNDLLKEIDIQRKSDEQKLNGSIELIKNDNKILQWILKIPSTFKDKKDFLEICLKEYENNSNQLEYIRDFEHLYNSTNALKEFFNETFLYRLLMKSLQIINIKILYLLRFFLQDIEEQLKTFPKKSGIVYFGQLMTRDQIDFLNESIDKKSFQFNSYLIVNENYEYIKKTLQDASNTINLHRVLFKINQNEIVTQYQQYFIFPIETTFRIISVKLENRIWVVELNAFYSKKNSSKNSSNPLQLAEYLREIGYFNESQILFELLLNQHPKFYAQSYQGLGRIAQDQGCYEISLNFYLKALEKISRKERPFCLNDIACIYDYLEDYENALEYSFQSLKLMKKPLNQSMSFNNIGIIYGNRHQYDKALEYLQCSLSIRKKYLSSNHPDIGITLTNVAYIYFLLQQLDNALENFQLALKCFSTKNYQTFFRSIIHQNIAKIYQEKNQLDQALNFYRQAQDIFQQFRPNNHPNLLYLNQQIDQIKQIK